MLVKATSTKRGVDLRDLCGNLNLKPASEEEAKMLAFVWRVLRLGGTLHAKPLGKKGMKMKWEAEA